MWERGRPGGRPGPRKCKIPLFIKGGFEGSDLLRFSWFLGPRSTFPEWISATFTTFATFAILPTLPRGARQPRMQAVESDANLGCPFDKV